MTKIMARSAAQPSVSIRVKDNSSPVKATQIKKVAEPILDKEYQLSQRVAEKLTTSFDKTAGKKFPDAKNATYIPALARQDPELFAMSARLLNNGKKISLMSRGDYNDAVTIQSASKMFQALLSHEANAEEFANLVGRRSSGLPFNAETSLTNVKETIKKVLGNNHPKEYQKIVNQVVDQLNKIVAPDDTENPNAAANPSDNYGAILTVYAGMNDKTAFHVSGNDRSSGRYMPKPYKLDDKDIAKRLKQYSKMTDKMPQEVFEKYVTKLATPLMKKLYKLGRNAHATPNIKIDFDVFKSEMETANNNLKLILKMQKNGLVGKDADPMKLLERYTANCSIKMSSRDLADAATTVANYGRNPYTGEQVFKPETVKAVLPVIRKTGLYQESDSFNKEAGKGTAKSGVGGIIVKVWPGKMAAVTMAPPLNKESNSAKGVDFFKELNKSGIDELIGA